MVKALALPAAGALAALAFPPRRLAVAAPVGVALGLVVLARLRLRRSGAAGAVVWAAGFFAVLLSWSVRFGLPAYVALVTVEAALLAPVGWVAVSARRHGRLRWAAAVTSAWVLGEAVRARWPVGGFEWGQLGYVWSDAPWRRAAAAAGVLGLTGLTVGVCALIASPSWPEPLAAPRARRRALPAALLASVALVVTSSVWWTRPVGVIDVAVVQVDPVCTGPVVECPDEDARLLARHVEATAEVTSRPDLLVWGEGALGAETSAAAGRAVVDAGGRLPAPLLAGVTSPAGPGRFTNRNVLYDAEGDVVAQYTKRHPVPFGEYVPARSLLGWVGDVGRLVPADLLPGALPGSLPVAGTVLGTVSSFEVSFSREVRAAGRGATGVVTLTSEVSYGRSAVSDQLLQMARLRAVELQKPVVVAATTGRSAVIEADGVQGPTTDLLSGAVLSQPVRLRVGATPYGLTGDAPLVLAACAALVWADGRVWAGFGRVLGLTARRERSAAARPRDGGCRSSASASRSRRLVSQNLAFAAAAIAVLVGFDLAGRLPLPLGVAGHEGSTVIVALNGLRLLRASAWKTVGATTR